MCETCDYYNTLVFAVLYVRCHFVKSSQVVFVNIGIQNKIAALQVCLQETQLPQRDSASAMHVFLGSLTDRALH